MENNGEEASLSLSDEVSDIIRYTYHRWKPSKRSLWGSVPKVMSCYHPPNRTVEIHDMEALMAIGPTTMAIGDFNAKAMEWNSIRLNRSGAVLRRFLEINNDVVAVGPEEPTYDGQGNTQPDVLGIVLLKAISLAELEVVHEGSSDNSPILLTVGEPTPPGGTVIKRRTNWPQFRAEM
ncbi:hypothetical protein NQ315_013491 [Exocentrus adspersus]|uniref:Endonuclease/exonuclease/phosphatase domain-containing protein n=1 Tax=Exocentrus adspersus TaxID=1586481 RepID=A0AAV8V8J3_9CUCU|nr:hypothetical protein NQ315_013491 [Exocentrus adspersus]